MPLNGDKTVTTSSSAISSLKVPLVSVVIPCLNRADFLIPTVESVLQQDYPNIECIVMDGGSTDATAEILSRYNGRIKWQSQKDSGPSDAINNGWRLSGGQILAWLNADDVWAPGAVSEAVTYFQRNSDVDVVYGNCGVIDEHGKVKTIVQVRDWNLEYALEHCDHIIYQAASFIRRSTLERVGWLWPKLCHDHELWLRISLSGGMLKRIPTLLAYARNHAGNLGYRFDIVLPLKLEITKKFISDPDLPSHLSRIRQRAVSNTYLLGMKQLIWSDLQWSRDVPKILRLLIRALNADKYNTVAAIQHLGLLADRTTAIYVRRHLPRSVYLRVKATKQRVLKKVASGSTAEEGRSRKTD